MRKFTKAFRIGSLTFIIAIMVTLVSTNITEYVPLYLAFVILLTVVVIGIIFDVIGVAATAADLAPLNAKAAKKIFGAKKALFLVKRADEVASFCCDIVGDICGTIGGALGAVIVLRINQGLGFTKDILEIMILALVAALTVGGKAYGKRIGIDRADTIIFTIGRILTRLEMITKFGSHKVGKGEDRCLSWKRLMTRRNSRN